MVSVSTWLRLYKELQRAAQKFPQYNYREFARRRVRDHFIANRNVKDEKRLSELFTEGERALICINRQTAISQSLPLSKLVIE